MNLKLAVASILAVLLLVFMAQNYEVVQLRFLFWKIEMSRSIIILAVLVFGMILGWLSRSFKGRDSCTPASKLRPPLPDRRVHGCTGSFRSGRAGFRAAPVALSRNGR